MHLETTVTPISYMYYVHYQINPVTVTMFKGAAAFICTI